MKYVIYCRKSSESDEKQALSIQAQVRELKDKALREGIEIVETLEESKSARYPDKRPVFSSMLSTLESGKYDAILCWHTNRLSRNPKEAGIIQQYLSDGVIKEIRTSTDVIKGDNCNDILLGVQFGANSQFSKDLSINTKRGIREKIALGQYPGQAPSFYVNYGTSNKNRNIKPDPIIAPYFEGWIDEIIRYKLTQRKATDRLKELGVRKPRTGKAYSKSMVQRILRNPVYCGLLKYGDQPIAEGKWEPLISRTKWQQLQDILDDKSKPSHTKWSHPYKQLCKCGKCGYSITGYTKVKKSGRHYSYYVCTRKEGHCGNPQVTEEQMEALFASQLSRIQLDNEILAKLKEYTKQKLTKDLEVEINQHKNIDTEYQTIAEKLTRLTQMRVDGEVEKEEYLSMKDTLTKERNRLDALRSDTNFNSDDVQKWIELFFDTCGSIEKVFANGTLEERRRIIDLTCTDVVLEDKQIRLNFREPWNQMLLVKSDPKSDTWGG